MKKLIAMVLGIFLLIPGVIYGSEVGNTEDYYGAIEEGKRVYDFAELLDRSEEEKLEENIVKAQDMVKMDIVILTVDRMFGESQKSLAEDFFDEGQFGYEDDIAHGSGILLLVDMENRQLYISTAGLGIFYYHEEVWNTILDDIAGDATDGEYQKLCEEFVDDVIYYGKMAASTKTYSDIGEYWYTGQYQDYRDLYQEYEEEIDEVIRSDYDYDRDNIVTGDHEDDFADLEYHGYPRNTFFTLFRKLWVDLVIGIVAAVIIVLALKNPKGTGITVASATYRKEKGMKLQNKKDHFLRRSTVSRKIETSSKSSGGSFHSSSGGRSHGGGGRGF